MASRETTSILTYGQPVVVVTDGSNCVPSIPRAPCIHAICLLLVFGASKSVEVRDVLLVVHRGAISGHEDVELNIGAGRHGLLDRAGILGNAVLTVGQTWARDDDVDGAAESGIGNLEVEDLAREVGDDGVGRREVDPGARVDKQLADGVAGAERGVGVLQGGDQGQGLLGGGVGGGLGVGVEEGEDTGVEVVVCNGAGQHVILRRVSWGR
jgi:hypothetical protein